jgi:hypothetical protein
MAMQSDFLARANRFREIMEANREASQELCETAKKIQAESEGLIRSSRALLKKRVIRDPEGPQ